MDSSQYNTDTTVQQQQYNTHTLPDIPTDNYNQVLYNNSNDQQLQQQQQQQNTDNNTSDVQQQEDQQHADTIDYTIHPSGLIPIIQNIVCTCNVQSKLNLKLIGMNARNAEFNPRRFSAVILRIRSPRATGLIFSSGKIVVTGTKNQDDCKLAARKICRILQLIEIRKYGHSNIKFTNYKIENIVGSIDCRIAIRLEGLAYDHDDYISYEPELFPGLIYRMVQPKCVLLIFVSGKVVITGVKNINDLYTAFEQIYPVLNDYAKINENNNNSNNMIQDDSNAVEQAIDRIYQNQLEEYASTESQNNYNTNGNG